MSGRFTRPSKLSDEDYKAILTAPADRVDDLCDQLGITRRYATDIRARRSWRAIKVAREIGLIPQRTGQLVIIPRRSDSALPELPVHPRSTAAAAKRLAPFDPVVRRALEKKGRAA